MFQWYKKEIPLLSIFGLGGGIASKLLSSRGLPGITATGGVISEYTVGSTIYRAHLFTSSGTFYTGVPVGSPKATGGSISTDGTNWIQFIPSTYVYTP